MLHLYYCTMEPSEALAAHRAELPELDGRHGLLHPRVFGSVLYGTDTEESDLDLLVDPAASTGLLALAGFKIEAEGLLGVPVSVLTPNALPPKLHDSVLQQARALRVAGIDLPDHQRLEGG
jgi:predicted nucleotidyltransferase